MKSKLMTIEEANCMLPLLRRIVTDIRKSWEQIIAKRTELEFREKEQAPLKEKENESKETQEKNLIIQELKTELNLLIERINNYIREVEDLGCYVEEFKRGIINFPSLYHGRKVFLCWGIDEVTVANWHELDEGYNDRVPIRDVNQFLNHSPQTNTNKSPIEKPKT